MSFLLVLPVLLLACLGLLVAFIRRRNIHIWLMSYLKQDWRAEVPESTTRHVLFCFVDHYEPMWLHPTYEVECQRVQRWVDDYPKLCEGLRDADGRAPIHSFFYPGEEYRPEHLDKLVDICRMGLGEIEIHLHHHEDTEAGLREKLRDFTRLLVERHDALPRHPKTGQPQWAFIHGNWALDNAHPKEWGCGVNNELIVLREEGCYVDYTLPAAPHICQTSTINQIYYATDDPEHPKSHDTGTPVEVGGQPSGDLMLIQGPLGFMWHSRKFGLIPRIENADIRTSSPPTPERVDAWIDTGIHVKGKPEWIFVKIHTHGTQERDTDTLLGPKMRRAYEHLLSKYNDGVAWKTHFVSAREMYNIAKAAEQGLTGEPGQYRDLVVARPAYRPAAATTAAAA
jgi:hypothetical protein